MVGVAVSSSSSVRFSKKEDHLGAGPSVGMKYACNNKDNRIYSFHAYVHRLFTEDVSCDENEVGSTRRNMTVCIPEASVSTIALPTSWESHKPS